MKDTVFRGYDLRGIVGKEFKIDEVYKLIRSVSFFFFTKNKTISTVLVAMDGRTHSPAIAEKVCSGLQDSGLNVLWLGICPAPVLYFGLHTNPKVEAGIMITASHNGQEYNGLKICLGKKSIDTLEIQEIKKLYKLGAKITPQKKGNKTSLSLISSYVDWLINHFSHLKKRRIPVIFDCGNGTAGTVLPQLIKKMEWSNTVLLYPEIDGTYPHHDPDPTRLENMNEVKRLLAKSNTQFGIGFDGDADRMAIMSKKGHLLLGDQIAALLIQYIIKNKKNTAFPLTTVLGIRSSQTVVDLLKTWGVQVYLSPVGHLTVSKLMEQHGAIIGAELSCHFMFMDTHFGYDDGIYAAMRFLEIMNPNRMDVDELLTVFPQTYISKELRIPCDTKRHATLLQELYTFFTNKKGYTLTTIDGVRVAIGKSWGLARSSKTQPVISLRFESDSLKGLRALKIEFFTVLCHHLDATLLKYELKL